MSKLTVRADEVKEGDRVLGKDSHVVTEVQVTKTGSHCYISLWFKTPKGKLVFDYLPGDEVLLERP